MYPNKSRTKEKLRRGEFVFGSLTLVLEPALAELIGAAGYDFMVADTEHTAGDGGRVQNMIRACQAGGITPIVRVRHVEEKEMLWVLDSGAEGLMIPMLESPEVARRAYNLSHYPPHGERTLCSATRTAGHGVYRKNFPPFVENVNSEMLLMGLIETPEAAARIEEIVAVREGIDVVFAGRADLSMKMGFTYNPSHPKVIEVTKRILNATMEAGKVAGVLAYDLEDAERWMDFGCQLIIFSQPEIVLSTYYSESLVGLNKHASGLAARASKVRARA